MVLKISPWPVSICGTNVARRKVLPDAQLIVEYFSGGAHQAVLMTSCAASWQLGKAACSSFDDVMSSIMSSWQGSLQQLWWRSALSHDTLVRRPPAALMTSWAASWRLGKAASSSLDDVMTASWNLSKAVRIKQLWWRHTSIMAAGEGGLQQLWWRHEQHHDVLARQLPAALMTFWAAFWQLGKAAFSSFYDVMRIVTTA